ncbi:MAG: ParB/RepB/Spo0J family partition protein [Thermoanaerobaculia bacterium]
MSESVSKKRGLPVRVKMRHDTHFVEELALRHDQPVGRMLALSVIEPDPNQPRTTMGDLEALTESIREKGVLEPILVRPQGGPDDETRGYRIISGERRYHAAHEAGLLEVPVIEMDVDEDEALEIALIENLQRKDLTPFEESEGYQALAERHGYTHEQIGAAVGKSRTVITETLSLLQMPPRVRDVVQALGISSKSLLLEVLKLSDDEDEMIEILEKAASQGLSRDDLRQSPEREARRGKRGTEGRRKQPYTFKFRAPDKTFNLTLKFRKSTVDRGDLITALEHILKDLKSAKD